MGVSLILLLGLWAKGNAQEVQSARDKDDMNQLVEMLQDDDVLEQVADKLVDKLADRATEQVDLSAFMDDATLAKAAKGGGAPPPKRGRAPAPAPEEEGGLDIGQIFANLGGGVTPTVDKNKPTRGQRGADLSASGSTNIAGGLLNRIRSGKAKAEVAYYGGMPKMIQPPQMRPRVNMRVPFANLDADDAETDGMNVFVVLLTSFFVGVALTLGVHHLWSKPLKASLSTLQGYAPLHD